MITRIHGRLSGMRGDSAIVEVNGLFYEVMLPGGLAQRLTRSLAPDERREVTFHTLHYIEGSGGMGNLRPRLIGFTEELDREFFELLTTVSSLGTKTALRALTIPIAEMAAAIESGDARTLAKLPRIGPRMADKIIAELKGKVWKFTLLPTGEPLAASVKARPAEQPFVAEAREILLQVGYRASDAATAIEKVLKARPDTATSQELVQEVFRQRGSK
ncbi:MAG TPA: Holliday junction branch migration protein RuvA [Planctomycetota bacterium]|nr:Holliday junction branch migration protein RuvA [Planctomycetota bacterium]